MLWCDLVVSVLAGVYQAWLSQQTLWKRSTAENVLPGKSCSLSYTSYIVLDICYSQMVS